MCFLVKRGRNSPDWQYGTTTSLFGTGTSENPFTEDMECFDEAKTGFQESKYYNIVAHQVLYGDCAFGQPSHERINQEGLLANGSIERNILNKGTMEKRNIAEEKIRVKEASANEDTRETKVDFGSGTTVKASNIKTKIAAKCDTLAKGSTTKKIFELISDTESTSSISDFDNLDTTSLDDVSEIYGLYLLSTPKKPSHIPGLIRDMPRTRQPRLYLIDEEEPVMPRPRCAHDDTIAEVFDMYTASFQDPKIPDVKEDVQQLSPLSLPGSASSASSSGSSSFYITPSLRSWVNGTSKGKRAGRVVFDPYRYYFCFSLHKTIPKGDGKGCDCLGCRQDFNKKRIT